VFPLEVVTKKGTKKTKETKHKIVLTLDEFLDGQEDGDDGR